MNKEFDYSDKIEAYLRNELSDGEKAEFEQLLHQDPLLRSEFQFQQEIISTIRSRRKAELKQRLDRVPIKGNGSSNLNIAGALVGGTLIVGLAGWLIVQQTNRPTEQNATADLANRTAVAIPPDSEITVPSAETIEDTFDESSPETDVAPAPAEKTEQLRTPTRKNVPARSSAVEAVTPSGDDTNESLALPEEKAGDVPPNKIASSAARTEDGLIIVDNSQSRYALSYKYTNEQLTLYGFEKPYQIIDIVDTSRGSQQRYLYYAGAFYKLDRNKTEITPLQEIITDPALLSQLQQKQKRIVE